LVTSKRWWRQWLL